MATTCIEQQVLDQLIGHSVVGLDIVRTQMLAHKGLLGFLRKNRLIAEMEEMKSYDVSIINAMQSLSAIQTTTGNCLHCLQDGCIGLFNPIDHEDEQTFLVATENCEIHKFRGDNKVEHGCRRIRKRTCGCIGSRVCDTERERLPFAFVTANLKLLANREQQLIRQTTRPDSGGLGDCYTFAARTVDGLRNSADRVCFEAPYAARCSEAMGA